MRRKVDIQKMTNEQIRNFEFLPLGKDGCKKCCYVIRNSPPEKQFFCKECESKIELALSELDRRNSIPKEWANQRPRDMAHKKDEPQPERDYTRYTVPLIGAVLFMCTLLGAWIFVILPGQPDRRQSAVAAAVEVSITPSSVDTNTPEPTATSEPSRTPYPTPTNPTETQRPMVQVEYIEVVKTVVVEVPAVTVVERVITATAQRPTPNATATVEAWEFIDRRSDERRANFWGWVGSILAAGLIAGGLAWYIAGMVRAGIDRRLDRASGKTTADEITENAKRIASIPINSASRPSLPTFDELQKIRRMLEQVPQPTQAEIEQSIYGYTGGTAYRKVSLALSFFGVNSSETE